MVGIIGRNGAGKSTLLKIISRITDPTDGYIKVRGRLASLLEVGTGFHPELTGRENIFLNGAILGMTRAEILSKFDEIVAFSEIERFLDTPVKRYSSGMYIRLAFSVAAHLNPEILVVDEVLAVGDMAFQKKCLGKMNDVSRSGRTILFVSHNISAIEHLCKRGIVLTQGQLAFSGTAQEAVHYYMHQAMGDGDTGTSGNSVDLSQAPGRWAQRRPLLRQLEFCPEGGKSLKAGVRIGAPLTIRVHFTRPPRPRRAPAPARTRAGRRELVPWPPGSCTECVASNTTGAPVSRMIASERMSRDQVVVAEARAALAGHEAVFRQALLARGGAGLVDHVLHVVRGRGTGPS